MAMDLDSTNLKLICCIQVAQDNYIQAACHIPQGKWSASRPPIRVQGTPLHWDCCAESYIRHSTSTRFWWCHRSDDVWLIGCMWQCWLSLYLETGNIIWWGWKRCQVVHFLPLWSNAVCPVVGNLLIHLTDAVWSTKRFSPRDNTFCIICS